MLMKNFFENCPKKMERLLPRGFKFSHLCDLYCFQGGVFSLAFIEEKEMIISGGKDLQFITWTLQLEKITDVGTVSVPSLLITLGIRRDFQFKRSSKICDH